jgi:hypothetical protein
MVAHAYNPTPQESKIWRTAVQGHPRKNVSETPSQQNKLEWWHELFKPTMPGGHRYKGHIQGWSQAKSETLSEK